MGQALCNRMRSLDAAAWKTVDFVFFAGVSYSWISTQVDEASAFAAHAFPILFAIA